MDETFTAGCTLNEIVSRDRWSLHPRVMSGPDYVGHRLIIYTGQFALVNLMGGMKVDDGLEGVQDENHKTQIVAEISICLLVFCTRHQKPAHHFKNLQM